MAKYENKDIQRFWSKVKKTSNCWEWETGLQHGYGAFSIGRKSILAHRFSFELVNGDISGKFLDHLCRNRKCVNPEHLEIVTIGENCRRGLVAKLQTKEVSEIRNLYKSGGYRQYELGKLFGVGQDEISRIVNFKRWWLVR